MPIYTYEYLTEGPEQGQTKLIESQIQMDSVSDLLSYFDTNGIDFISIEEMGSAKETMDL